MPRFTSFESSSDLAADKKGGQYMDLKSFRNNTDDTAADQYAIGLPPRQAHTAAGQRWLKILNFLNPISVFNDGTQQFITLETCYGLGMFLWIGWNVFYLVDLGAKGDKISGATKAFYYLFWFFSQMHTMALMMLSARFAINFYNVCFEHSVKRMWGWLFGRLLGAFILGFCGYILQFCYKFISLMISDPGTISHLGSVTTYDFDSSPIMLFCSIPFVTILCFMVVYFICVNFMDKTRRIRSIVIANSVLFIFIVLYAIGHVGVSRVAAAIGNSMVPGRLNVGVGMQNALTRYCPSTVYMVVDDEGYGPFDIVLLSLLNTLSGASGAVHPYFFFCFVGFFIGGVISAFTFDKYNIQKSSYTGLSKYHYYSRSKRILLLVLWIFELLLIMLAFLSYFMEDFVQMERVSSMTFTPLEFGYQMAPTHCLLPGYFTALCAGYVLLFNIFFMVFDCRKYLGAVLSCYHSLFLRRFSTYTYTLLAFSGIVDWLLTLIFSSYNTNEQFDGWPILYIIIFYILMYFALLGIDSFGGVLTPDWLVDRLDVIFDFQEKRRLSDQHLKVFPTNYAGYSYTNK